MLQLRVWQKRLHSTIRSTQPTIFALSTPLAKSAIAVVRISGPQSSYIYNKLTKTETPPKNRIASVRKLYSPTVSSKLLDESLTLFFAKPRTYTGLDLLELHLHGGIAIIKAVLEAISALHDPDNGVIIRQAEPGEFSKQAFANGKYDLTALEGISEMINAETELQRLASLASMSGQTKDIFNKWRQDLLENVANLTTLIDFGEDHDLEETAILFDSVSEKIKVMESEIGEYLHRTKSSEVLLKGINLTLVGPPNAGKSSILNTLSNREAAIVSNIAGTTRDVLELPLEIGGFKVVLGDTAGIRLLSEADEIEQEGIRRAMRKSEAADFVIMVLDPTQITGLDEMKNLLSTLHASGKQILIVLNKEDLYQDRVNTLRDWYLHKLGVAHSPQQISILPISCLTGAGIEELRLEMIKRFKVITETVSSDPVIISSRVQDILQNDVLYGFKEFFVWKEHDDVVLATECLRQSIEGIGKITGEAIGVEEILGVVFSNFCIGK